MTVLENDRVTECHSNILTELCNDRMTHSGPIGGHRPKL